MKNFKYWQGAFIAIIAIAISLSFSQFSSTIAFNLKGNFNIKDTNQSFPFLEKGMYVIVGVFQIRENAMQYVKSIKIENKSPQIARNRENNMYYVYAYTTKDDLEFARQKRGELRATNQFYDAWIMYVGITLEELMAQGEEKEVQEEVVTLPPVEEEIQEPEEVELIPPPPMSEDQETFNYRFNVINATTLREVPGYVTIIDAARNKAMKSVSTNQVHPIEAPDTQTKEIIALCDIFGFVKDQISLKIDNPMSSPDKDRISQSGGVTTIKFTLARHKVGDILTMYNVYFYNNAAIMKPESKFELNSLLSMLKENEKLEIRIHGHTNGNAAGKIIKLKDDDINFFEVTPNNIEGVGSAKELSKARADIIMRWLIEQGIDKKRMELKGWGGKKMIYGKNDAMAGRNVRVEIEILKG